MYYEREEEAERMKRWMRTLAEHWYIPLAVLLITLVPVRALGAAAEQPSDTEDNTIVSSFGKAEGQIGNIMKTSFMEFTVNAASLCDQYQSLTPDEGMHLLVLNITTHATQKNPLVLYDTDYQIQWNGESELDYSEPVTYRDEWADFHGYKRYFSAEGLEGIFPGTGVLANDETITYDYVYQVPSEAQNFRLMFKEYFEDESLGDMFIVTIQPDNAGVIEGNLGTVAPLSGEGETALEAMRAAEAPAEAQPAEAGANG